MILTALPWRRSFIGLIGWRPTRDAHGGFRTRPTHRACIQAKASNFVPGYARLRGRATDYMSSYGFNRSGNFWSLAPQQELGLGPVSLNQPLVGDDLAAVPGVVSPVRENEVISPSDMICVGDAHLKCPPGAMTPAAPFYGDVELTAGGFDTDFELGMLSGANALAVGADTALSFEKRRHGGLWNVACCDAHVESLKTKKLFSRNDPMVVKRWNRDNLPH